MIDYIKKLPHVFDQPAYMYGWPEGWDELVNKLIKDVLAVAPNEFKVLQIKEKFAGLRFYYSNGNESVRKLVDIAESKSMTICQNCGSEGRASSHKGWMVTLCEECDQSPPN